MGERREGHVLPGAHQDVASPAGASVSPGDPAAVHLVRLRASWRAPGWPSHTRHQFCNFLAIGIRIRRSRYQPNGAPCECYPIKVPKMRAT